MMKTKIILTFILMALLSSCQNNKPATGEQNTTVSLFGSTRTNAPTSYIELFDPEDPNAFPLDPNTLSVYWSAGDEIGIFAGPTTVSPTSNVRATLTEGVHQNLGKFMTYHIPDNAAGHEYYIYYPFAEGAEDVAAPGEVKFIRDAPTNTRIRGKVPNVQEQKEAYDWSHFKKYSRSVAISSPSNVDNEVPFELNHCLSFIAISLYTSNPVGKFELTGIELQAEDLNAVLAGTFESYFHEKKTVPYTVAADGTNKVTLDILNPTTMSAVAAKPDPYLITIIPADLATTNLIFSFYCKYIDPVLGVENRTYRFNITGGKHLIGNIGQFKFDLVTGVH